VTDPFDALRAPVEPVHPDPGFAAALRARIERALTLPRGVVVTSTVETPTEQPAATAAGAAIPYLAVPVGAGTRALDWYAEVLGARLRGEPITMPDGKLGHAELELGGGVLYLAEEFPDIGFVAPRPGQATVSLVLTVPDVGATSARAVAAGGELTRPISDAYGHRNATVVDPFGHRWMLQTPLGDEPPAHRPGDIGYAWLSVPDVERAVAFYGAVLGWTVTAGWVPQGRQVEDRMPGLGLAGGAPKPALNCSYGVADVAAAVERVRAGGGQASDPQDRPYGPAADCVDDQGVPFALHRADDSAGSRPPVSGGQGDLSYLTLEVVDSARARAFYGAVLGWTFTPGRVEDGWGVEGVVPMTGLHGGHAEYTAVPMWRVDDVVAAVERVRAAGGTATDPERQPYGTTAECTDDQGSRFYLGGD
jgi:predicted enzyme related to lactoylglutathione lyase